MKAAVRIIQVIVGVLFIISGLVKANDPVGLGYKMQEFFELWSEGLVNGSLLARSFSVLHEASLGLSVFMITLEIFLGAALLLGWQKKLVLWLLLALMLFFTFLTGYAHLSGRFTNCGCFGDCLPITPFASFLKDCALLAMVIFLLLGSRFVQPVLSAKAGGLALVATILLSLGLQWYVLNYLPLADCLPFKKGASLPAQMKPPPGAVPDSFAIVFVYEKGGRQHEFSPEDLPADFTTYKFIDRKQKLVRKGNADAPIRGFTLTNDSKDSTTGNSIDSTETILSQPAALLLFASDFADTEWITEIKSLVANAEDRSFPVYVVSPSFPEAKAAFAKAGVEGPQFFNTDFTIVRTVARTNPTILLLRRGTVVQKWSKNQMEEAAKAVSSDKSF